MTKKTRLIILLVCAACFFIIAPLLVFYSMGYRVDFKKMVVTETGGIYVRTFPAAEQITIDNKIKVKPGIFSNTIFVQSLLPGKHTVSVKKNEYYDYFKTIPVLEEQVTKLENILLFKNNIQFEVVKSTVPSPFDLQGKYIIRSNSLYYSNITENSGLSAAQKAKPLIKKINAFALQNNNIIWLGTDGFLYKSDSNNLSATPTKITLTAIKISKTSIYKILSYNDNLFLVGNGALLQLNSKTSVLENFSSPIKDAEISPDGVNVIYYDDHNIYISPIAILPITKTSLYKSYGTISSCIWLNNSYIIFTDGNKITFSEIDYRGNINTVTLPQTITVSPTQKISLQNPQIFFDQQTGKLYILTNKILLVSEKITT